jgi:hypothetical protein
MFVSGRHLFTRRWKSYHWQRKETNGMKIMHLKRVHALSLLHMPACPLTRIHTCTLSLSPLPLSLLLLLYHSHSRSVPVMKVWNYSQLFQVAQKSLNTKHCLVLMGQFKVKPAIQLLEQYCRNLSCDLNMGKQIWNSLLDKVQNCNVL